MRLLGAARDVAGDFAPAGAVAGMVTLVLVAQGVIRRRNPELEGAPLTDGDGVVRFR